MRRCSVCDSISFVQEYRGSRVLLCSRHRGQMQRHGKILKKTRMDRNDVRVVGDVAYISLRNRDGAIAGTAKIDVVDLDEVRGTKWFLDNCGYARTGPNPSRIRLLHKRILESGDMEVDHINGNRLDNRRINLRIVSRRQNSYNRKRQKNNTSGSLGVYSDMIRGLFVAEIKADGRKIFLGRFKTLREARSARESAERRLFGSFRRRSR